MIGNQKMNRFTLFFQHIACWPSFIGAKLSEDYPSHNNKSLKTSNFSLLASPYRCTWVNLRACLALITHFFAQTLSVEAMEMEKPNDYAKTSSIKTSFTYEILQDQEGVRKGQRAVSLLTLKVTPKDLWNACYISNQETMKLSKREMDKSSNLSSLELRHLFFLPQYLSVLVFGEPDTSKKGFHNMKIEAYAMMSFFKLNESDTQRVTSHHKKMSEMLQQLQRRQELHRSEIFEQLQSLQKIQLQSFQMLQLLQRSKMAVQLQRSQELQLQRFHRSQTFEWLRMFELLRMLQTSERSLFNFDKPETEKDMSDQMSEMLCWFQRSKISEMFELLRMYEQLQRKQILKISEMFELLRLFEQSQGMQILKMSEMFELLRRFEQSQGMQILRISEIFEQLQRMEILRLSEMFGQAQRREMLERFEQLQKEPMLQMSKLFKKLKKFQRPEKPPFKSDEAGTQKDMSDQMLEMFEQLQKFERSHLQKMLEEKSNFRNFIDKLTHPKDFSRNAVLTVRFDSIFLDSLNNSDCVLTYTTWPIRKLYYLSAKQEISKNIDLDFTKCLSNCFTYPYQNNPASNYTDNTAEERSLYIAEILEYFCQVHPIFNEIFRKGNYHPLSLAASSDNAQFNPDYHEELGE